MNKLLRFFAREFIVHSKHALIAAIIAAIAFLALYFIKQPDYYTPQEIAADQLSNDSIKDANYANGQQHQKRRKTEYDKYENLEAPTVITGHRGIKSEYAVSVVAGENLTLVNDNVKANFLDHIFRNASTVFLLVFFLLFVRHYFVMIFQ